MISNRRCPHVAVPWIIRHEIDLRQTDISLAELYQWRKVKPGQGKDTHGMIFRRLNWYRDPQTNKEGALRHNAITVSIKFLDRMVSFPMRLVS